MIIWTIVGGVGTLSALSSAPWRSAMIKMLLGQQTLINNFLLFGTILIVVVLVPRGVIPTIQLVGQPAPA